MPQPVHSAAGHSGKVNSFFNQAEVKELLSLKAEIESLAPFIATADAIGEAKFVGQTINLIDEPDGIAWKPYEANQQMVPDQVTPTGSCLVIDTSNYASIKIDNDEELILGDYFDSYYNRVMDKTAQELAPIYDKYILGKQIMAVTPKMKGNRAGRVGQINLGSVGNPLILNSENIGTFFSQVDILFDTAGYRREDRFMVVPPEFSTLLLNSSLASYQRVGEKFGLMGDNFEMPPSLLNFRLLSSRAIEPIYDPSKQEVIFMIPIGISAATAFRGGIVQAKAVDMEDSFGDKFHFREVHGGAVVDEEALALAVVKLDIN